MKYKKIGDVLILDKKYPDEDFEELSKKHHVKTIMKIDHIQGTKREPVYKVLYGEETETVNKDMVRKLKQSIRKTGVCLSWICQR